MTPTAPLLSAGTSAPAPRRMPRHIIRDSVTSLVCIAGLITLKKLGFGNTPSMLQTLFFLGWMLTQAAVVRAARTPLGVALAVANFLFLIYDIYLTNWPATFAAWGDIWKMIPGL